LKPGTTSSTASSTTKKSSLASRRNLRGNNRPVTINYGFDRVRFISPVRTGSRVHGRFVLSDCRLRRASILMTAYNVTVEIENEIKPALTANWIAIAQFNPKDRPKAG
ncbi:MaoC/PaaZ C-terminal domain-containing protein, partial [Sinorhizobium meliloti]|uniref:MaoC/PaaZ C-terminal domain-containing protein n=1 Tax=Rhizobium meliloti TaxID=382 RepID=UPI002286C268